MPRFLPRGAGGESAAEGLIDGPDCLRADVEMDLGGCRVDYFRGPAVGGCLIVC